MFVQRLPRLHERAIYSGFGILVVTGLAWLWVHDVRQPLPGPQVNPVESWLMRVHGIAAYVFLVLAGALLPVHVRMGWRGRRNHRSGAVVGAMLLLLGFSGLVLYYESGELARTIADRAHWPAGIAATLVLGWHALRGRSAR